MMMMMMMTMKHVFLLCTFACVWTGEPDGGLALDSLDYLLPRAVASRISNLLIDEIAGFVHISKCGAGSWFQEINGIFSRHIHQYLP